MVAARVGSFMRPSVIAQYGLRRMLTAATGRCTSVGLVAVDHEDESFRMTASRLIPKQ
jgi:hypothetical protein